MLYFGSFDKLLHAVDAETKKELWTFRTGDAVKGGPAYWRGTVYTGSYDGKVYAVDAETGKLRWSASSRGGLLGSGNFYATPAVAYGRVFVGNTDGAVYAYGAESGHLLWSKRTGGYVYSSAAVAERIIYVGSYDKHLYGLDAATGDVKWSFDAHAPVSGAPTVMAGIVYFSSFGGMTYGLEATTGKLVWRFAGGRYTPIVADTERTYLVGRIEAPGARRQVVPRIVYVTARLPYGDGEPFVATEVRALERAGWDVTVVPVRAGGEIVHRNAASLETEEAPLVICLDRGSGRLRRPLASRVLRPRCSAARPRP